MQHSSAQAASLAEENGILRWQDAECLGRAAAIFHRLGYLCIIADRQARNLPLPTPEERGSALASRDSTGFIIRRGIARALAARLLDRPVEAFRILSGTHGAPQLGGGPLYLSFSARGDLGLIGVGRMPIGVDYESTLPPAGIPWNLLRAEERGALEDLPPDARPLRFLSLWRAKEAALKARGIGFGLPPEAVTILGKRAHIAGHDGDIRLIDTPTLGITLGLTAT